MLSDSTIPEANEPVERFVPIMGVDANWGDRHDVGSYNVRFVCDLRGRNALESFRKTVRRCQDDVANYDFDDYRGNDLH